MYIGPNFTVLSEASPNINILYNPCKKAQDVVSLYSEPLIFRGIKVENKWILVLP